MCESLRTSCDQPDVSDSMVWLSQHLSADVRSYFSVADLLSSPGSALRNNSQLSAAWRDGCLPLGGEGVDEVQSAGAGLWRISWKAEEQMSGRFLTKAAGITGQKDLWGDKLKSRFLVITATNCCSDAAAAGERRVPAQWRPLLRRRRDSLAQKPPVCLIIHTCSLFFVCVTSPHEK